MNEEGNTGYQVITPHEALQLDLEKKAEQAKANNLLAVAKGHVLNLIIHERDPDRLLVFACAFAELDGKGRGKL